MPVLLVALGTCESHPEGMVHDVLVPIPVPTVVLWLPRAADIV